MSPEPAPADRGALVNPVDPAPTLPDPMIASDRLIDLGTLGRVPESVLHDLLIAALVTRAARPRLMTFLDALRERLLKTLPTLDLPWLRGVRHETGGVWHLAETSAISPRMMGWELDERQYLEPPPANWETATPPYPIRALVLPTALCGYDRYALSWDADPTSSYLSRPVLIRRFAPWAQVVSGVWPRPMCRRCAQAACAVLYPRP